MIRKLAGQTAIYGLGTIIPRFINYLLTPYLTYSLALNEYHFGVMGYFYATIPFIVSVLTMGMETGFFRFCGKAETQEAKDKLFSTIWSTFIIGSSLFFILVAFFTKDIYNLIDQDYAISIIPIVAGIIVFDVVGAICFAKLREQGKAKKFTIIRALTVIVNVSLVVFFYSALPHLKDNILFSWMWVENYGAGYVFLANLIASGVALLMLSSTYKKARFLIDKTIIKSVLFFSIPLFISGFNGIANDLIDRQLLAILSPKNIALEQIGIYSATLKITAIMAIFTQMYRYAAEPMFLSKLKKDDFNRDNAEAMKFFVIISLMIFLGISLFSDVFMLLVSPAFRGGSNLVPLLLLSSMFTGILVNLSFWYKFNDKTFFALIISTIGVVITIAINIMLIPSLSYTGSAWARLASTFTMVVVSYMLNQKYFPIPYDIKRIGEYFAVTAILFGFSMFLNIEPSFKKIIINSLLFFIFVIYIVKREKLISVFRKTLK